MDYPRYKPRRPTGSGAFFDFIAGVEARETAKLESSRINRRNARRQPGDTFRLPDLAKATEEAE